MHEISVDALRESIVKSMKLDHVLAKKDLVDPVRVWEFAPPPDNIRRLAGSGEPEPQLWIWLLEDGLHFMSMSKSGLMRLWDIQNNAIMLTIDVQGIPLCWDHFLDDQGLTMIVNTEAEDE
jgi:hypothetical protein